MEIWNHITRYMDDVQHEEVHAFDALVQVQNMEKALKKLKEVVKEKAMEEMELYSEKEKPTRNGYEFIRMNNARYDYKNCPAIVAMDSNLKLLKKQANMGVKKFLDEESGEVYDLGTVIKKQTSYVKCQLAKK